MSSGLKRKTVLDALYEATMKLNANRGVRFAVPRNLDGSAHLEEFGVDSISIAEIVDDLERRLEVELPFDELMLAESIDQFVDVICERGTPKS